MASLTSKTKVFYEVEKHTELPTGVFTIYSYVTSDFRLSGIAANFDEMVNTIRTTDALSRCELEMVQVESLVPVRNELQRLDVAGANDSTVRDGKWEYPAFDATELHDIFMLHKVHRIPLHLTVGLACKLLDINITRLLKETGYSKNYFSNSVNGTHPPSVSFRKAIIHKLGIDPWLYSPVARPDIIRLDIIPAHVH